MADVILNVEVFVVDPNGVFLDGDMRQPLPIARDHVQLRLDQTSYPIRIDTAAV